MPRSFLVRKPSVPRRKPNYSELQDSCLGEKPFCCSLCSRAFADRSNLRAHLQTHSEVKKYQCQACARTFSRMSLLHKHQEAGCAGGPR